MRPVSYRDPRAMRTERRLSWKLPRPCPRRCWPRYCPPCARSVCPPCPLLKLFTPEQCPKSRRRAHFGQLVNLKFSKPVLSISISPSPLSLQRTTDHGLTTDELTTDHGQLTIPTPATDTPGPRARCVWPSLRIFPDAVRLGLEFLVDQASMTMPLVGFELPPRSSSWPGSSRLNRSLSWRESPFS